MPSFLLSRFDKYRSDPHLKFSWGERSYFQYPHLFITYADGKNWYDLRKEWSIPEDVDVMADSGGFQFLSGRLTMLDPVDVIEWQNRNANRGMALDLPPYTSPSKKELKDFEDYMYKSVLNYKVMYERRKESMLLYAPIHGIDDKTLEEWKNATDAVGDWDAYAFASPHDPLEYIRRIKFIIEHKIEKPIHFLMAGGTLPYLLLARFSIFYPYQITVDSSTFSTLMKEYGFIIDLVRQRVITIGKSESSARNRIGCLCPVCQQTKDLNNEKFNELGIIAFHNMYMLIWRFEFLSSIASENYQVLKEVIGDDVQYIKQLDHILGVKEGVKLDDYIR